MTCLLAIETATDVVGCAVADSDGVLAACSVVKGRQHGELLASLVQETLAQSGLRPSQLNCVAVDVGPGLYTGLRVGLATASALAYAWQIPALGLASSEVLAFGSREFEGIVVPVIDARRSEFFFAAYRGSLPIAGGQPSKEQRPEELLPEELLPEELLPVQVGSRAELAVALDELPPAVPKLLVGNGVELLADSSVLSAVSSKTQQISVAALAELAVRHCDLGRAGLSAPSEPLRPRYLRRPDIGPGPALRQLAQG